MSPPETELLDALDAALAGDPVREGYEDVALLITDMRAQAPDLSPQLQMRIEEGLAGGFARGATWRARLAGLWPQRREWLYGPAAGVAVAAAAAVAIVVNVGDDEVVTPVVRDGDGAAAPQVAPAPERQSDLATPKAPEGRDGGAGKSAPGDDDPKTGGPTAPDTADDEADTDGAADTDGGGTSGGETTDGSTDTPPATGDAPSPQADTSPDTSGGTEAEPDDSTPPSFTDPDPPGRTAPPPPPAKSPPPAASPEAPAKGVPDNSLSAPMPTAGTPSPRAPDALTITLGAVDVSTRRLDRGTETLSGLRISGTCTGTGGNVSIGRAAPYRPLNGAGAPTRRALTATCSKGRFEIRRTTLVIRLGSGALTARSGGRTFTVRVRSQRTV